MNARAVYEDGVDHHAAGRLDEAISAYREAIRLQPDLVEAHINLGVAFEARGALDEAAASYRAALAANPEHPFAHVNLGNLELRAGRVADAIACYRAAIAIQPVSPTAHRQLAVALEADGQPRLAAASRDRAEAARLAEQGQECWARGAIEDAIAAYRGALSLDPAFAVVHSLLLLALHYRPDYDRDRLAAEARTWGARHAAPLAGFVRPHRNRPDPDRRLRIGYVSADFNRHSVGYLLRSFLPLHDRSRFEVYCYANNWRFDEFTEEFRAAADGWRVITRLDDDAVADLVRRDGIDILVDLAGHTPRHRLEVFARKPRRCR